MLWMAPRPPPKRPPRKTKDQPPQITGAKHRFAADLDEIKMLGKVKKSTGTPPFDEHGNPHPDTEDIDFPEG